MVSICRRSFTNSDFLNAPRQKSASSQATNSEDTIAYSFYSQSKLAALSMLKKVAPETYDGKHDFTASTFFKNSASESRADKTKSPAWAASAREVGLVKGLIRAGAKADLTLQKRDLSPLELGCGTATTIAVSWVLETVKELIANGEATDRAADFSPHGSALSCSVRERRSRQIHPGQESNVATPSRRGENPLRTALLLERFNFAHQLLDLNASPAPGHLLRSDPTRHAPIQAAACVGDISMTNLLLCQVSALLGEELVIAAWLYDVELVERLMRHGARYDDTWYGETAVQAAISWGNRDLAATLIRASCIITGGEYAQALMNGYHELAGMAATYTCSKTLIKPGPQGQTPLEAACLSGNIEIADNLSSRDDVRYESGALCAASWNDVSTWRYDLVEILLRRREPSVIDEFEATALGIAARYEDVDLISLLLVNDVQSGPALALDSAAVDGSKKCWWRNTPAVGKSPLHIAAETGNYLIVKSILAQGFEADGRCFLQTLSLSTNGDDAEIVMSIWMAKPPLDYGAACSGKAFVTAIGAGGIGYIRNLIAADLDVDGRTSKGWTLLQLSVQYGMHGNYSGVDTCRSCCKCTPSAPRGGKCRTGSCD
ncbi:hypothetical protein DL769_004510 [Monosporascus sp. CRB-8-3]|nr:hypothetical protein DL769_004510 [Monosporascus sp. CRB-8-3]